MFWVGCGDISGEGDARLETVSPVGGPVSHWQKARLLLLLPLLSVRCDVDAFGVVAAASTRRGSTRVGLSEGRGGVSPGATIGFMQVWTCVIK